MTNTNTTRPDQSPTSHGSSPDLGTSYELATLSSTSSSAAAAVPPPPPPAATSERGASSSLTDSHKQQQSLRHPHQYTDQHTPTYFASYHDDQERSALIQPGHPSSQTPAYNESDDPEPYREADDLDEDDDDDLGPDGITSSSSSSSSTRNPLTARLRRLNQRSHTPFSSSSSPNGRKPNWLSFLSLSSSPSSYPNGRAHGLAAGRGRMGWIERHRIFSLSVLVALWTVLLTIYFSIPSTLYIYLPTIFLAMPLSLAIDIRALAIRGRSTLTRSRIGWIIFGLTPLVLSTWHPLSLLFFPGWDAESTSNSISALTGATLTKGAFTGEKLAPLPEPIQNRTYYFAANLYNVEPMLPSWTSSMLRIIERVGKDNVYLSIYESNSKDQTKRGLTLFEQKLESLGIAHKIRMDDESTRVGKDHGERVGGRIEYLSMVRNVALQPLDEGLRGVKAGKDFDRVVWFNDVYMDPNQVIELLATNNGTWDQVCAFDYISLGIYDTWVTRDTLSQRVKPMWPHYQELADVQRLREGVPIEVNACWNGITAFDAKWYMDSNMDSWPRVRQLRAAASSSRWSRSDINDRSERSTELDAREESSSEISRRWDGPFDDPPKLPLRFRPSKVCIASECMLFSFDMHRLVRSLNLPTPKRRTPQDFARPLILMNPKVAVTYDWPAWILYQHILRWNVVKPWRIVWQDLISHRLFGWMTDWGKKPTACAVAFAYGWIEAPAWAEKESGILTLPMAS
ncbi:hypothetical protein OC846_000896 [Tilletia horrida]|uniref:Glycosyltransferase family 69 protein n=1 Tax=Tilletia horrida TaxID=155126 RepID=A0AAN6GTR4_9BASI|nr:hypothetical protein OC846_000896 [Tilletia horrida]KAK0563326.1 hypothetical protein OC861_004873 [Tilletia horrida]